MTKDEKLLLRQKLPMKWSKIVAERTNVSVSYVRRIMEGRAEHVAIEKAVLELAIEYQSQLNEVEQLKNTVL